MNVIPPIDWMLIGRAVEYYVTEGYTYVEAPWFVDHAIQQMTFEGNAYTTISYVENEVPVHGSPHFLVASGEQSLLDLDLAPGLYVTCTPCFRTEVGYDFLTRPCFMKVELFDNREEPNAGKLKHDAWVFMKQFLRFERELVTVETPEGADLTIGGVEVGSYGQRDTGDRCWAYGTGLALPRFSAAIALLNMPRINRVRV